MFSMVSSSIFMTATYLLIHLKKIWVTVLIYVKEKYNKIEILKPKNLHVTVNLLTNIKWKD